MDRSGDVLRWREASGERITVGEVTVIPRSRALTVRTPFGILVWNRPSAVIVEGTERAERIPIVDVTRRAQLGLLGLILATVVAMLVALNRRRRHRSER